MNRGLAVILGSHPFPHGNASANRMLTMAMTWRAAGFDVLVVNDDPRAAAQTSDAAVRQVGEINYLNLGAESRTAISRARRRRTLVRRSADAVSRVTSDRVTHVILGSMLMTPNAARTLRLAFPGAEVVVDVVERHDRSQFPRGGLHPYYFRHLLTNRVVQRPDIRAIAISTHLAAGPLAHSRALVIPPCVDLEAVRPPSAQRTSDIVQVSYVGSPGTKDDLSMLATAVSRLSFETRTRLHITLAGVTRAQWATLPGMSAQLAEWAGDSIDAVGMLDRDGVTDLLHHSHFTYLLRDPAAGFARYGFPSKVPESLAAGCPVITNLTSDLAAYLTDGANSIVVDSYSTEAVVHALARAVEVGTGPEYGDLQLGARRAAETSFAPNAWARELVSWLDPSARDRGVPRAPRSPSP